MDETAVEFYREINGGDYLAVEVGTQGYYRDQDKDQMQGRAAAIACDPSSVCTTGIGLEYLAEKCVRVARADVPPEWRRHINLDHDGDHFEDGGHPLPETPLWLDGRVRAAVANALGYWPDTDVILDAVEQHEGLENVALANALGDAEEAFDAAGGRGVELADAIDSLRIADAVRGALQKTPLYVRVEYDLSYTGGDYDKVGQFALVPVERVDELGMEEAFTRATGHDPTHIIHYSPDEPVTANGEPPPDEAAS